MGWLIRILLVLVLSFLVYQNRKLALEGHAKSQLIEKQKATLRRLSGFLEKEISAERDAIQSLKESIAAQREALGTDQAAGKNSGAPNPVTASLAETAQNERATIQDLERQLKDNQTLEAQTHSRGRAAESQTTWGRNENRAELQNQIHLHEQSLKDLKSQFQALKRSGSNPDDIRQQIDAQNATLTDLRNRLRDSDRQWGATAANTHVEVNSDLAAIKQRSHELRDHLSVERANLTRLNQQLNDARGKDAAQKQDQKKLADDAQARRDKIAQLESDLKAHEQRLRELSSGE